MKQAFALFVTLTCLVTNVFVAAQSGTAADDLEDSRYMRHAAGAEDEVVTPTLLDGASSAKTRLRNTDGVVMQHQSEVTSTEKPRCRDSPLQILLETTGGSNIPFECRLMLETNAEYTSCSDMGVLATHCPKVCGMCSKYRCSDSQGTFFMRNGKARDCKWLKGSSVLKKRRECKKSFVKQTCRATCNICGFDDNESNQPSAHSSAVPSVAPSFHPSSTSSLLPSLDPTSIPVPSLKPSLRPSSEPSLKPSSQPSLKPSLEPSTVLSSVPSSTQSLLPSMMPSVSTKPTQQYPSFEVIAKVGGNLGDEANRLGVYTFDKMYNGAAAYKNDKNYIVFYKGDRSGWQWVTGYNYSAGNGPTLSDVPDAQAFVRTKQFQIDGDYVDEYASFEVIAKVGGNLGDDRLGVYTFDKMYNGAAAYKNDKNYIVFYDGDDDGWQWVTGYNKWAGDGPKLSDVPDAQAFVRTKQFQIDGDDPAE